MSNFHIFEHAYKKALSNGRRPRDAVQYGLKKYVLHIIDDYKFYADEETQQCFVDEAFKVYCDERHADDTHGDAARAAIRHIHRTFKDAKKARCNHCGKAGTSSHAETFTRRSSFKNESSARGKPKYNYDDPRNIVGQASSTCAKPAHNNADLRNNEFPSSAHTRASERRSSCKKDRPQHSPFDFEDMFGTLPETSVLLVVVLIIVRKIADMNTRVVIHILRGRVEVSHTLLVLTVAERMEVTHLNLILAIDMTMGTMIALLIMDVLIVTMMKRTSFTLLTTDIPDATTSPIDHGRPCPLVSAVSSSTIPSSQMIVATDVIHPSPHTSSVPAIMTSTHVGSVRVTTTSSLATPFPARMASTHASSNLVGTATRHLGLLAHHPALLSTTTSILTLLLSARHPFATSPSAHPLILTPAAAAPHPPASNPRHVSTPS
jgi:hypothetical protein